MIILIGESGSGKASIRNELIKRGYRDDEVCIQMDSSIEDVKNKAKEQGFDTVKTIYISVPAEERTKRMLTRGDSVESIQRIMEMENEKFKNAKDIADFVVKNDVLQDAVEEIIRLDRGE